MMEMIETTSSSSSRSSSSSSVQLVDRLLCVDCSTASISSSSSSQSSVSSSYQSSSSSTLSSQISSSLPLSSALSSSSSSLSLSEDLAGETDHETMLNCSGDIFNVTETVPIEYARVMYGVMMPPLVAVTLAANLLIVAVLHKRHMRTPTNLVLMWMAVADLLTLLSPFPWYLYMYTAGMHRYLLDSAVLCYVYNAMTEHVPIFFHTTSIWLTILLAGQRYIYICHLTIAKTLCTVPNVKRAIGALFVLSFSVQISRFFDTQYEHVFCRRSSSTPPAPSPSSPTSPTSSPEMLLIAATDHASSPLRHQISGACLQMVAPWVTRPYIYFPLYFGFRVVFVNLGPCIALVILNVLLFGALQRAQAKRRKLLQKDAKFEASSSSAKRTKRNDLSNSTTYMLIVVVSVFLLVEIPMAVATIVHLLVNMGVIHFEHSHLPYTRLTVLLCNFLIMLSFPLNFAIYCGMSAQFRNTFTALFADSPLIAYLRAIFGRTAADDNGIGGPRTGAAGAGAGTAARAGERSARSGLINYQNNTNTNNSNTNNTNNNNNNNNNNNLHLNNVNDELDDDELDENEDDDNDNAWHRDNNVRDRHANRQPDNNAISLSIVGNNSVALRSPISPMSHQHQQQQQLTPGAIVVNVNETFSSAI